MEQRKDKRGHRLYIDVMRNAYAQTVVAPYVVRARPGAAVAVPLNWDELSDSGLEPGRFTLHAARLRLAGLDRASDPWDGLTRHRYSLAKAQERLDQLASHGVTSAARGS
jgi:bifunctional non-homologous end joining protein LigD